MVRRWRLIALTLVGGLVLVFPSTGSALLGTEVVELAGGGPVPDTLTIMIGGAYPVWWNSDTVTHTVAFADGLCSIQVPPGDRGTCPINWHVGQYSYTVDGTIQADITFVPEGRTVTLTARSHTVKRGTHLHLHGLLSYGTGSQPPCCFTDMPVMVLARHDRHHPFQQIATAPTGRFGAGGRNGWPWWLDLHPKRTTIYIVEVNSQTDSGQFWQNATSKPFKVVVRARH